MANTKTQKKRAKKAANQTHSTKGSQYYPAVNGKIMSQPKAQAHYHNKIG